MATPSPNLVRAAAEALEARQLLSAVTLQFGTLTVTGDSTSPNHIALTVKRGNLQLLDNRHPQSFPLSSIEALQILGGSANDVITLGPGISLPTEIDGLGGNDRITGSAQPGIITTGPGRSIISPGKGDNYVDLSLGSNILNLPAASAKTKSPADIVILNSTSRVHGKNPFAKIYPVDSAPTAPLMPWKLRGTPALNAVASASANNIITLSLLTDTVTLTGGKNPTGSLTFTLTAPDNSIADSETIAVNGPGTYSTANTLTATLTGLYTWTASYSGDNHNNPVSDTGPAQSTAITLATPSLLSSPSTSDGNTAGTSALHDSITLTGGLNPTGSLTLTLTAPDGATVDSEIIPVTGPGVYASSLLALSDEPGDYSWSALYSGDSLNNPAATTAPPIPTLPPSFTSTPPSLTPGSGFPGPTTVPTFVAAGFAANELPMARWDVVPYQTFASTLNVGVVAFHINGISRVAFSVNGGPWASVTQPSLNPTTNVVEYFAQLDASKFANGTTAEVRAIAYPTAGIPRVLNSTFFIATSSPAATQTVYVSKTGSDTNDGSLAHPFLTLTQALNSVTPGGTVQIQDAGTYSVGDMHFYNKTSTTWTTIRQNPSLAPNSVIVSQGSTSTLLRPFVAFLHWQGVAFDFHGIAQYYVENGGYVWFDKCTFFDSVGWIDATSSGLSPIRQQAAIGGDFATDCTVHDAGFGFVDFSLVRNSHCYNISGDVFTLSSLVINSTVDNVQLVIQGNHNDLSQYWANAPANTVDNIIVYGVTATNIDGVQDIFLVPNTNESFQNMAFVNYSVQNNATTLNTNFFSQFSGVLKNILLQNLNLPNQPLLFRTDLGLQAADVVISGSSVKGIFNQGTGAATQVLPPGVTVQ